MSESKALRALEKENTKLTQQRNDLLEVCEKSLEFFVKWDIQQKVISGLSLQLQAAIAKVKLS